MIEVQKQQKQKNVLNRPQRRTPLNVVVEKIGTARATVHGDLSKESLKELLMSELSLISRVQSPETNDTMTSLEKKLKTGEDVKVIESDQEKQDQENKEKKDHGEIGKDEEVQERDEKQYEEEGKDKQDKISDDRDIVKQSEKKYQDEESQTVEKNIDTKGTKTTEENNEESDKIILSDEDSSNKEKVTKKGDKKDQDEKMYKKHDDKDKATEKVAEVEEGQEKQSEDTQDQITEGSEIKKKYQDKEKTTRKTGIILEDKEKREEVDCSVKYLFRKKHSKERGKECKSEKGKRGKGWYLDDFDKKKQIEEISDDEDFTEDYENEEKESCVSISSSNKDDILALSYDSKWLRKNLKKPLILAMNEIAEKKPRDPVNYLGFWLLNYRNSQEILQRKRDLEIELVTKRNEWNMLHDQAKKTPELLIEGKESKNRDEEENMEDRNFSNYEFR